WFDASIGDTYYWTLADAVAEAENEDMITVLQDVSVPNGGIVLNEDKEITIDLNGMTISAEEDTVGDGVFHITAGTLILEDSSEGEGTVNGLGQNNWSIGIWADGGDLIINGGSYTNVGAGEDDHYDLIYVSQTSQVEINGGTFKCHTPAWTLNQKDAYRETSSIAVKGGSFYQFDPDNNSAEGEGTSFVAEGYVSEKDGDNYIVREYVASELTTDIGEIEFVIGVPTEFTFTTTANDDKDTMVIGTSNFSDAEAIEKLEYYEVQNDTWIELTGDFGPAAGFPMADATSKFRVTFKTAGDYSFTASMKHAETEAIVCSTVVEFTVTDLSAEAPTESAPVTESYDVAIADSTNGRVAVNTMRAGETSRVTLTVKADAGYVLESLTVTDKNGKEIKVTEKDGKYQFRMPASDVTVKAVFAAEADIEDETFTDVAEDAYYHDAVLWAVENGITNGMTESTFAPNATCTRAQMVTFLWRAAGCPVPQNAAHSFTDLDKDAYYYNAVLWAVEKGITNGVSLDAFDPNGTVTRGQAMTFLWRMDGKTAADADHTFTDVEDGAYYEDAVAWGADEAITNGTSATTFSPDDACIRGQIVTFLYNYLVK
ncbi:MAG: S-layer homology domain-containing protein, partial [Clostridia bacterium]|nr:S-layer homology domain-containing protein [Clostridia bacterium]